MRIRTLLIATFTLVVLLTGCDNIFGVDNYDRPDAMLSGQVVFEGQPVGLRTNGVQLELWQPGYQLNQKMPVHIAQDGTFSARIFNGNYELNLLPGNGPWVNNPTRIPVVVNGTTTLDVPVTPHHTLHDVTMRYDGSINAPHGAITATFTVRQRPGSPNLEYVGLYVGTTAIVDRTNSLTIANRERTRSQILTQLTAGTPVTITVNLPSTIRVTSSPDPRTDVFVRIGAKTLGVAEMLFSQVQKTGI